MADQELQELLTEFKNLAESEHHSFLNTIVNNEENSNIIFAALALFEVKPSFKLYTYVINQVGV